MPKRLILELNPEQENELLLLRDRAHKPYLRERAAALLKIAHGETLSQIAQNGLLRKRGVETISDWFHRYLQEGGAGLRIRPGRGRKPSFSP